MYSIVLMAALTTGGDAVDFGRRGSRGCCGGCYGGYSGCYGGRSGRSGRWGGCYGGYSGCYGGCSGRSGRWGGCYGGYSGCYGGYSGCYGGGYAGYGCWGGGYGCYGGYGCGGYASYSTYNPRGPAYVYDSAPVTYNTAQAPGTAPDVVTADSRRARLVISLPADARLTVNDTPTTETSARRVFTSPPLEPGRWYHYTLKAEGLRDGQRLSTTQEVAVQAGRETDVSLSIPSGTASTRR